MDNKLDAPREEDGEQKEVLDQLRNAEKTFRKLVEKRNELNDQGREAREQRDALNEQKKALVAELRELQGQRDAHNAEAREWKEKRNEFQRAAKALIEEKRKARAPRTPGEAGQKSASGAGRLRDIEGEIRRLERQQETSAMPIAKENELIKKIQELRRELEGMKVTYSEEAKLLSEIKGTDAKIDELFRLADEAHKKVVDLSNAGQACHDRIGPILDQLKFLDAESDKKHQDYLSLRKQADEQHAEATKLREDVDKLREKRAGIYRERTQIITEHKNQVRTSLFDEVKLDEKADDAVKALLSKGKITL